MLKSYQDENFIKLITCTWILKTAPDYKNKIFVRILFAMLCLVEIQHLFECEFFYRYG
jgi:hypothetical protein